MRLLRPVQKGANVRRRGEHVARGDRVLQAGQRLAGPQIGLALGSGQATVTVYRALRVGVLSTGDELADPPAPLPPAGSYDANRAFLGESCRELGFTVVDLGICSDDPAALARCIDTARHDRLDILLTTGGAAQGDADVVRRAGGVHFVPIAARPGRGIAHACWLRDGHRLDLLGLPGNAVAAFVMFHLVARPVLLHLAGAAPWRPVRIGVALAQATRVRGGRVDYRRARLVAAPGTVGQRPGPLVAELLPEQGSAMLRTIVDADALVAVGPQCDHAAGDLVEAILLRGALE
jgi:molybdopterin molybdotransferase